MAIAPAAAGTFDRRRLFAWAVRAGGCCGLWLAAIALAGRSMTAPWPRLLDVPSVALAAAALGAAVYVLFLVRPRGEEASAWSDWNPTLAAVLAGAALTRQAASPAGAVTLWAVLGLAEAARWASLRLLRGRDTGFEDRWSPPELGGPRNVLPAASNALVGFDAEAGPQPAAPDAEVFQQWTRRITAEGADELQATLRVPFAPGQRTAQAHLSFCPPFACGPSVRFLQTGGPQARIKLARALPYGARLELKLERPESEAAWVTVDITASGAGSAAESG